MIKRIVQFCKKVSWRVEIFTLANILTLLRIVLTPFLAMAIMHRSWTMALSLLLIAGITDVLDGYLARLFGESTLLGQCLDPIADKFLLITCFLSLALVKPLALHIPYWFVALVLLRELIIISGSLTLLLRQRKIDETLSIISPTWWGKCTTFFQLLFIGWLIMCYVFSWQPAKTYFVTLTFISLFSLVSLGQYIRIGLHYLRRYW